MIVGCALTPEVEWPDARCAVTCITPSGERTGQEVPQIVELAGDRQDRPTSREAQDWYAGRTGSSRPSSPTVLAFDGLDHPQGVAVDAGGNVYVGDDTRTGVWKLPTGVRSATLVPLAGLGSGSNRGSAGIAVDTAGNLYVADYGNNRVVKLPAS